MAFTYENIHEAIYMLKTFGIEFYFNEITGKYQVDSSYEHYFNIQVGDVVSTPFAEEYGKVINIGECGIEVSGCDHNDIISTQLGPWSILARNKKSFIMPKWEE